MYEGGTRGLHAADLARHHIETCLAGLGTIEYRSVTSPNLT